MNTETKISIDDFILESLQSGLAMADPGGEAFLPFMKTLSAEQQYSTSVLAADNLQAAFSTVSDLLSHKIEPTRFYSIIWNEFLAMNGQRTNSLTFEVGSGELDEPSLVFTQAYEFRGDQASATALGEPVLLESVPNRLFDETAKPTKIGPFNSEDWELLLRSPTMIFFLISAADGEIGQKEILAFIDILSTHPILKSDTMENVLLASAANTLTLIEEYVGQPLNIFGELTTVKAIVDAVLTKDEAGLFFDDLIMISEKVAKSCGRISDSGFIIGEEEETSLEMIKLLLENGLLNTDG